MNSKTFLLIPALLMTCFSVAGTEQNLTDTQWVLLNSDHGWSIRYPKSWDAYVMDYLEAPPLEKADNINFDGPGDCYRNRKTCGLFQIRALGDTSIRKKYSSTKPARIGQAFGYWLSETHFLFICKKEIWEVNFGPNGNPREDIDQIRDIFQQMINSLSSPGNE